MAGELDLGNEGNERIPFVSDDRGDVGPLALPIIGSARATLSIPAAEEWFGITLEVELGESDTVHTAVALVRRAWVAVFVENASGPLPGASVRFFDDHGATLASMEADVGGECRWEWSPDIGAVTITAFDSNHVAAESAVLVPPRRNVSAGLLLARSAELVVTTVDTDGIPVLDCLVSAETHLLLSGADAGDYRHRRAHWTPRLLPGGAHVFDALPSDTPVFVQACALGRSRSERAVRLSAAATNSLELILEQAGQLEVVVIAEDGTALEGARVGSGELLAGRTDEQGRLFMAAPEVDAVIWAVSAGKAFGSCEVSKGQLYCRVELQEDAVFHGQVIGANGEPVGLVRLTPLLGARVDADRIALGRAVLAALGDAGVDVGRSDEQGRFAIGGMQPGLIDVLVAPPRGSPLTLTGLRVGVPVEIRLPSEADYGRQLGVLFKVRTRDGISGAALGGVIVSAFVMLGGEASSTGITRKTDVEGRVDLGFAQPGRFRFHAEHAGFVLPEPVEVELDHGFEEVVLELVPTCAVRVDVRDAHGAPVPAAILRGTRADGHELQFSGTNNDGTWSGAIAIADSRGRVVVTIPVGRYSLKAMVQRGNTWVTGVSEAVVTPGENTAIEIVIQ